MSQKPMIRKSDQVRDEEKDGRPCQDPQHRSHVQSAHMEEKSELPREKGMSLANLPQARLGRRRVPSCTTDFCSASSMLSFRLLSAEAAS